MPEVDRLSTLNQYSRLGYRMEGFFIKTSIHVTVFLKHWIASLAEEVNIIPCKILNRVLESYTLLWSIFERLLAFHASIGTI